MIPAESLAAPAPTACDAHALEPARAANGSPTGSKPPSQLDLLGVRAALNVLVASTLLWLLIRRHEHLDPIWAIASMIAASDPNIEQAVKFFRGRLTNALVGCITGLLILFVGGTSEWKIPVALAASVIVSNYLVRVPTMWRQAPITATIVVASGLMDDSKVYGLYRGLSRVGQVLLGCVFGLAVTFVMSKVWPAPQTGNGTQRPAPS